MSGLFVTSPVDICNLALDLCNQAPIKSIDAPSSSTEQLMARWYAPTRRDLLRRYIWNFAKERSVVARAGTPAFDYSDQYVKPVDLVRFISVSGERETWYEQDIDLSGDFILLNAGGAESLKLRYVKDVEDVSKFDPTFTMLLACALARAITMRLNMKGSWMERLMMVEKKYEAAAAAIDCQERPPLVRRTSLSYQARRHRYGWYPYSTEALGDIT